MYERERNWTPTGTEEKLERKEEKKGGMEMWGKLSKNQYARGDMEAVFLERLIDYTRVDRGVKRDNNGGIEIWGKVQDIVKGLDVKRG